MSVLFETSLGDIIVDLETTLCPKTSLNFLKLCKTYSYNFCSFHNIIKDFIAQTGDPTDTSLGGTSIFNTLPKTSPLFESSKYFKPELNSKLRHEKKGTLSMIISSEGAGSQFFFTLIESELEDLDGKHCPFGKVIEGFEVLDKINEALCDTEGRPLRDIRIRHVIVLDDPFPDPPGLVVPPSSPVPTKAQLSTLRVGDSEEIEEVGTEESRDALLRAQSARAQALTLEMVGDLPFADVSPPENVLFVCKLNSCTVSEDLELIFSRFGKILNCEIIRDVKSGDSLGYAFVEFEEREDAERAFVKMDKVLVDDRRIHVDFSQSVSKLHDTWVYKKTGGRAPPNRSQNQNQSQSRPSNSNSRNNYNDSRDNHSRGGDSRASSVSGGNGLVFDLGERDEYERNNNRGGGSTGGYRGSGGDGGERRRNDYDRRDGGRGGGGGGGGGNRDSRDSRDNGRDRRRSRSPDNRNRDRDGHRDRR